LPVDHFPQVIAVHTDNFTVGELNGQIGDIAWARVRHRRGRSVDGKHTIADVKIPVKPPPIWREHRRRIGDPLAVPRRHRDRRVDLLVPRHLEQLEHAHLVLGNWRQARREARNELLDRLGVVL
jgi:hypothetical protein